MSREQLEALAAEGLVSIRSRPSVRLENALYDLAAWSSYWCIASGDARFCIIHDFLTTLADAWEQRGAVSTAIVGEVDLLLRRDLPAVLSADESALGAQLAQSLQSEISRAIRGEPGVSGL